jgi:hypothetical protein
MDATLGRLLLEAKDASLAEVIAVRKVFVALLLVLLCASCKSAAKGAREHFGQKYSCPDDRIHVKDRSDLRPSQALAYPFGEAKPPGEVANDPGRLATWQADKQGSRDRWARYYDSNTSVFEVDGCDHHLLLVCGRNSRRADQVSCEEGQ